MIPQASADYYREQQRIMAVVLTTAQHIWGTRPPRDFDAWFTLNAQQLVAVVTAGQARAVMGADEYVGSVLDELGTPVDALAETTTRPLVGVASNGGELDSLMYGPVIRAKSAIAAAGTVTDQVVTQAWASGMSAMLSQVQMQIADAARASTAIAITTRPGVGYVRMLNPPSCSRCAVLAGKFFRYNAGFKRHKGCDCRHIPTREDTSDDLRTDPDACFASLSQAQQDRLFTKAGAQVIREGADVGQVVNARSGMYVAGVYGRDLLLTREGVTRRGIAGQVIAARGRNAATTPRLMPEAILQIASDREDALRLLRMNAYIT